MYESWRWIMSWPYYAATFAVILSGFAFCAVLIHKYKEIKRNGNAVACEVTECYAHYSSRLMKVFFLSVTFEYERVVHTAKCSIRCFRYHAPKVGEEILLVYVPGETDALYPANITKYPVFNTAVLMAVVSLLFVGGLISSVISLL